jgi:RNase P subunit RPR2
MQAYCMKCRAKKEMKSAKSVTMKNGKPATQGICSSCGTKMFKIGKS